MECKRPANFSRNDGEKETSETTTEAETPKALQNDVVLQNIFKYLCYKDLKSCRAVKNCTWLKNSKKAWWSRTKVIFRGSDVTDKITEYLNETEITRNATNYKFEYFQDSLNCLWNGLQHSIKYLEFEFAQFPSVNIFRNLIYTRFPNLKKLVFSRICFDDIVKSDVVEPLTWQEPQFGQQMNLRFFQLTGPKLPVTWMELLSHFPNLQAIDAIADLADIYRAILLIRQHDPKMLKLNHIKIYSLSKCDHEEFSRAVLLDPNLSLEIIDIQHMDSQPEILVDIVDVHAKSLKELSVLGEASKYPVKILPQEPLYNLDTLCFKCCVLTADIFKFIPNVKKLDLDYVDVNNLLKKADRNLKLNSCKELILTTYGRLRGTPNSDLELFLSACPNVEILETNHVNNLRFSMICGRWAKLVSCNLTFSEVDTSGLLGFDPDSQTSDENRNPNITNLKGLQTFSMESAFQKVGKGRVPIEMSNCDVILKELEKLHHLKKFELNDYKLLGDEMNWNQLFAKFQGH